MQNVSELRKKTAQTTKYEKLFTAWKYYRVNKWFYGNDHAQTIQSLKIMLEEYKRVKSWEELTQTLEYSTLKSA